jgi:hypothetical protein
MKDDSLVVIIGKNFIVAYGVNLDKKILPGFQYAELNKDFEPIFDELKIGKFVVYGFELIEESVPPAGFEKLTKDELEQLAYLLVSAGQRSLMGETTYRNKAVMHSSVSFYPDHIPSLINTLTSIQAMTKN